MYRPPYAENQFHSQFLYGAQVWSGQKLLWPLRQNILQSSGQGPSHSEVTGPLTKCPIPPLLEDPQEELLHKCALGTRTAGKAKISYTQPHNSGLKGHLVESQGADPPRRSLAPNTQRREGATRKRREPRGGDRWGTFPGGSTLSRKREINLSERRKDQDSSSRWKI